MICHAKTFFVVNYSLFLLTCVAKRSADAWGTMQDIKPRLWSEKGLVKNSDREVIPDLSPDGAVFDVTITDSNENDYFFEIIVGNTGEESSILEYVVFTSTDPSGVDINNRKVELKSGETHTKIIHIDTDGLKPGTSSFNVIVNSNGQTGAKYKTYKIIVHKEYDSYYQDFNFSQSKPTVLQKSQFLTRYTYTGREYNRETGQYYYRARTYVSSLGRFSGKDKIYYYDNECVKNKYYYVKNCPIGNIDPTGLRGIGFVGMVVNESSYDVIGWGSKGWKGTMVEMVFEKGESWGGWWFWDNDADFICATEEVPIDGKTDSACKIWNDKVIIIDNPDGDGIRLEGCEEMIDPSDPRYPCKK